MEHEYSVLGGVSRARVGRCLSLMAASASAAIVFVLLWSVDLAKELGIPANLPPTVLSLLGAGTVFGALYWLLDRHAWRWDLIGRFLKVPDLSGEWECHGQTINPDGTPSYTWHATITIIQTWDKLRIRLKTQQSGSNSNTAALICDEADGYRLFYSYKNEPKIGEVALNSHRGFADIVFSKDLRTGTGEYFNGHGRYTFGTMTLRRN